LEKDIESLDLEYIDLIRLLKFLLFPANLGDENLESGKKGRHFDLDFGGVNAIFGLHAVVHPPLTTLMSSK